MRKLKRLMATVVSGAMLSTMLCNSTVSAEEISLTYDDCLKFNTEAMIDIFPGLRELYDEVYAERIAEYADSMEHQFDSIKQGDEKIYTFAEIEAMTDEEFFANFPEAEKYIERKEIFIEDTAAKITEYLNNNYGTFIKYHGTSGEILSLEEALEMDLSKLEGLNLGSCGVSVKSPLARQFYKANDTEEKLAELLEGYDYYINTPIKYYHQYPTLEDGSFDLNYTYSVSVGLKDYFTENTDEEFVDYLKFFCCIRQVLPVSAGIINTSYGNFGIGGFTDYEKLTADHALNASVIRYFSEAEENENGVGEITLDISEDEMALLEDLSTESPYVGKPVRNGDVTFDEAVDLYDVIWLSKNMIGMIELTDLQLMVADYNADSEVDLYDAVEIAKTLM